LGTDQPQETDHPNDQMTKHEQFTSYFLHGVNHVLIPFGKAQTKTEQSKANQDRRDKHF
jgi:hypothetical protein